MSDKELEGDGVTIAKCDQVISTNNPYLSLHALDDTFNYETMRIRGLMEKRMLCLLIDIGNTHNLLIRIC